jgi:hypothetical protein
MTISEATVMFMIFLFVKEDGGKQNEFRFFDKVPVSLIFGDLSLCTYIFPMPHESST